MVAIMQEQPIAEPTARLRATGRSLELRLVSDQTYRITQFPSRLLRRRCSRNVLPLISQSQGLRNRSWTTRQTGLSNKLLLAARDNAASVGNGDLLGPIHSMGMVVFSYEAVTDYVAGLGSDWLPFDPLLRTHVPSTERSMGSCWLTSFVSAAHLERTA